MATDVQPAVTRNFDGNYDAWENMANAWGTQWGDWEDVGAAQVISQEVQQLQTFGTNNSGKLREIKSLLPKVHLLYLQLQQQNKHKQDKVYLLT